MLPLYYKCINFSFIFPVPKKYCRSIDVLCNICSFLFQLSTTTAPAPPPSCFPSMAKLKLENGNLVTMSELQLGNKVQIGIVLL